MPDRLWNSTARVTRRCVVGGIGTAVAAPALIRRVGSASLTWPKGNLFSLGVASGSPAFDGFVIWTRLAPEPLSVDLDTPGGMPNVPVTVGYQIGADPSLKNIVLVAAGRTEDANL